MALGIPSVGMDRGRGRAATLPAWMTEKNAAASVPVPALAHTATQHDCEKLEDGEVGEVSSSVNSRSSDLGLQRYSNLDS